MGTPRVWAQRLVAATLAKVAGSSRGLWGGVGKV